MQSLGAPLSELLHAARTSIANLRDLAWVATGYCVSAWLYVPVHELMHAYACIGTGGSVTRLEIDALYGAAWLQKVFPFVAVGSQYAGQLTGFDTKGNDWIYLATDLAPYLITILVGVPLLRAVARRPWPQPWRALALGVALPPAFAAVLSLGGDYYEMGSIMASRLRVSVDPGFDVQRWRSDDVVKLANALHQTRHADWLDTLGIGAGLVLGACVCWLTYWCGLRVSQWLLGVPLETASSAPAARVL